MAILSNYFRMSERSPRMRKATDMRITGTALYFLPVQMRVPLKFGQELTTSVTCARASVSVKDGKGQIAKGWGETPLSVQWVWPSKLSYETRHKALKEFTLLLADAWASFEEAGHAIEIGFDFQETVLPALLARFNEHSQIGEPMPWLAALVCSSAFDIALHDAFGGLHLLSVYETYNPAFMNRDLADFLIPADGAVVNFSGSYPEDFFITRPPNRLRAWHLVGGVDLLDPSELTGAEPQDGYPVLLPEWIERDGLKC